MATAAVAAIAVVAVCAIALAPAAASAAVVASLTVGAVSATASAIGQYKETGEIDVKLVLFDGFVGAINGALATSGITAVGSIVAGVVLGAASSIGNDLLSNEGKVDWNVALESAALGGLGGLLSGPGAKDDILKLTHSQTILDSTIQNGTKRAIAHQALVRNKHAKSLFFSAIRFILSMLTNADS